MFNPRNALAHPRHGLVRLLVLAVIATLSLGVLGRAEATATPAAAGYKDFSYGSAGLASPTASKPESKLWYHDGLWWGSLFNPGAGAEAYHIYRLNPANPAQGWVDTGVPIDVRNSSRADVLFDGATLYVVSHRSDDDAVHSSAGDAAEPKQFFRYSYNAAAKTWSKLAGPVDITGANGSTESLVITKDGTGRLWTVYVEGTVTDASQTSPFDVTAQVKVSTSGDNGATWSTFPLGVAGSDNLTGDDVASIVSYNGRTGIMWSNQRTRTFYFASHTDGTGANAWTSIPVYHDPTTTRKIADDHINLKVQADSAGRLFAAVKTGLGEGSPDIVVLQCLDPAACATGGWSANVVYTHPASTTPEHTRPILLIDSANQQLHVFTSLDPLANTIYRKSAAIGSPFDSVAAGTPFIQGGAGVTLNDVTSTKQTLNSAAHGTANSGIVVLASDTANRTYYWGHVSGGTTPPPPPPTGPYKLYLPFARR